MLFLSSDSSASEWEGQNYEQFNSDDANFTSEWEKQEYSLLYPCFYDSTNNSYWFPPDTELYESILEAMGIIMPGHPSYVWDIRYPLERISPETIKSESIKTWKKYDLNECIQLLKYAKEKFGYIGNISNYTNLDQSTYDYKPICDYYGALASVAGIWADAFEALRTGQMQPNQIFEELRKWFDGDTMRGQVEGIFFAIELRLIEELEIANQRAVRALRNPRQGIHPLDSGFAV
jgi:hypothetical protein